MRMYPMRLLLTGGMLLCLCAPLYADIQQRVMTQALIVPIRDYINLNVAASSVKGLRFDARGWFPQLSNVRFQISK